MNNVVLSTRNIDELISDVADEVAKRILNLQQELPKELDEKLFTVQETAVFLNLTVPTIYSKVSKGELPVMKRGKRLYFSSTELLEYLKEGKVKTVKEISSEADRYLFQKKGGTL